jgi:GT2 family glycosyltransferase
MLLLPRSPSPVVSVILVAYGGWDWPYRSLDALREATEHHLEVVCVDNASWDGTGDLLEELVAGAVVIRNRENRGFAGGANQGAAVARGEYLCFLNPDCLVRPGWLEPLLRVLDRPGIGATIPRFMAPDGAVQEAGSVVDRQGWSEAYGRGLAPDDPATRFPRLVDYGSAACLLMRASTFRDVGGFDEAFFPAYCEDVDLAFRLREAGLHTRYEPASTVEHAGTVSTASVTRDRLIEHNRRLLLRRWGHLLADRPPLVEVEERPHRLLALRDALAPDRLLVLPERLPGPAEPLGRALLELAEAESARVTVAVEGRADRSSADRLLAGGVEVAETDDLERWLAGRRYHASVVLMGPRVPAPIVHRWQPQAVVEALEDARPEAISATLGVVTVEPPGPSRPLTGSRLTP